MGEDGRGEAPVGYGCGSAAGEDGSDLSGHDLHKAIATHAAMFSVWERYGATPEGFSLPLAQPMRGQEPYPLRPELIESTYYLYLATRDNAYLNVGRQMLSSIETLCR